MSLPPLDFPVQLTVALPMYRARHIGWLPLEALCRQEGIDFQWELVVAEEQEPDPFGGARVNQFRKRLEEVGCVHIRYIKLPEWIPLSQKWRLMAKNVAETSEVFVFQSADGYCHPRRLRTSFDLTLGEYDWSQSDCFVMYEIGRELAIVIDRKVRAPWGFHTCGNNMAVKTYLVRDLPKSRCRKKVDTWLYKTCQKIKGSPLKVAWDRSLDWQGGFQTAGLNNISRWSQRYFRHPEPPARLADFDFRKNIPGEIMTRLSQLAQLARSWKTCE